MNQTSATGNSAGPIGDTTALLTTVHLAWIAVFAVLVVIGILYGMRVKRRRVSAERRAAEHAQEAGVVTPPDPAPDAEPSPSAGKPVAAQPDEAPALPEAAGPDTAVSADAANGSVSQLKGLGPKVTARLAELGITTVGQIAALDHDAAQALDAQLGPFRGRMERDRWIEQARFLAAGDRAGFEAVFGKLDRS